MHVDINMQHPASGQRQLLQRIALSGLMTHCSNSTGMKPCFEYIAIETTQVQTHSESNVTFQCEKITVVKTTLIYTYIFIPVRLYQMKVNSCVMVTFPDII